MEVTLKLRWKTGYTLVILSLSHYFPLCWQIYPDGPLEETSICPPTLCFKGSWLIPDFRGAAWGLGLGHLNHPFFPSQSSWIRDGNVSQVRPVRDSTVPLSQTYSFLLDLKLEGCGLEMLQHLAVLGQNLRGRISAEKGRIEWWKEIHWVLIVLFESCSKQYPGLCSCCGLCFLHLKKEFWVSQSLR